MGSRCTAAWSTAWCRTILFPHGKDTLTVQRRDQEAMEALTALESQGFVAQCISDADIVRWQLTDLGMQRLKQM